MKFTLPELPYAKDALQPHMSAETLEYHHGKHHNRYVYTLNELIPGTHFENLTLEEIIKKSDGPIFNNAAQVWNHTFFWNCLAPKAGGEATGPVSHAITKYFGSFKDFHEKFTTTAMKTFGSGWTWLVQDSKTLELEVISTSNAACPLTSDKIPLLTCDVWEHAYYIDYRNDRAKFIEGFWKLVNWEFVNQNLKV